MNKIQIGKFGEDLAAKYLLEKNWELIEKNYFCRYGEIDLIMKDQEQIVFVEVKTRKSLAMGSPLEAISLTKKQKILKSVWCWLAETNIKNWRIDVVGVLINQKNNKCQITHVMTAFSG